ncbi:hypothetical protein SCP_0804560 [Sparassis crispa]|uniref:Uncharacterized protein n=1 Tax=Sparassis crispa TaxID=139825 RepID=A0A401GUQ2_9APHY|nr:hypothetical protein SCP_0804560 [Sparassis crispa]GBE85932.1 hypothetical protein SCP_0804560 [Sparassis crispa]
MGSFLGFGICSVIPKDVFVTRYPTDREVLSADLVFSDESFDVLVQHVKEVVTGGGAS